TEVGARVRVAAIAPPRVEVHGGLDVLPHAGEAMPGDVAERRAATGLAFAASLLEIGNADRRGRRRGGAEDEACSEVDASDRDTAVASLLEEGVGQSIVEGSRLPGDDEIAGLIAARRIALAALKFAIGEVPGRAEARAI